MSTITVYQFASAFRVVHGAHATGDFEKRAAKRAYTSALEAFTTEGDASIKAAIARIAPEVLKVPATQQHHVQRAGAPMPGRSVYDKGIAPSSRKAHAARMRELEEQATAQGGLSDAERGEYETLKST